MNQDAHILTWHDHDFAAVDEAWITYTGLHQAEWFQILHPDDIAPVIDAYQTARQSRSSFAAKGRIRRADGEYHWFLITGLPVQEGYSGMCVQIEARSDELWRIKSELRETEARYQTLFNTMAEGFGLAKIITDEAGAPIDLQYLDVNPAFERLTGLSAHDVLTKTAREIFPHMAQSWIDTYSKVALTGQPIRFQGYASALDIWVEVFAYQTAPSEFAHIFIDITENKRKDEALRISEERLRVAQELSLDAFTILESVRDDANHIIDFKWVYVNPVAGQIIKHSADDLIGKHLLDVLPGNRDNLFPLYVRVVETGEPHDIELPYESDGIQGWFRNMTVKLGDGVAISFSDITKRKRSELHLKQLEDIASLLLTAITPKQVTEIILQHGFSVLGATAGSIVLLDASERNLLLTASIGYPPDLIAAWQSFPVDHPQAPLAEAVRKKAPVLLHSVYEREQKWAVTLERPRDTSHVAWAALPLMVDGRVLGGLGLSFPAERIFEEEERRFMLTLADHCALALERAYLAEQAKAAAATQERQRLARDLHDAVSQVLFSSTTIAESLTRLWQANPQKAVERLAQVVTLNRAAMAEMRMLLLELRPEMMDKTELKTLLKHLVEAARGRKKIHVDFEVEGPDIQLPLDTHIALYRIAQESIHNALKHSQASELITRLTQQPDRVVLMVKDNGQGFDPTQTFAGLGLVSMRERAAAVGGTMEISSLPGHGTCVTVVWRRS